MSDYNLYPGVDSNYNFPPEIRRALAEASEFSELFVKPDALIEIESAIQEVSNGSLKKSELCVNVADFGAIGNNTTDDTTALNNAIQATPSGGYLLIPKGMNCRTTSSVIVNKPINIIGGTITMGRNYKGIDIRSHDVYISGLKVVGPGTSAYENDSFGIFAEGTSTAPWRNITLQDVKTEGMSGDGIRLIWVIDSSINNALIKNTCYAGIMLLSCTNVKVIGGTVKGLVQRLPAVNSYGIAVSDLLNTLAARSSRILILGVTVEDVPAWEGIDNHGGDQVSVIGCTIINCGSAIAYVVGNETRLTSPERGLIANNVIERGNATASFPAIRLVGQATKRASGSLIGNRVSGYATPYEVYHTTDELCTLRGNNPTFGDSSESGSVTSTAFIAANGGSINIHVEYTKTYRYIPHPYFNVENGRITVHTRNRTLTGFDMYLTNWTTSTTSNVDIQWFTRE